MGSIVYAMNAIARNFLELLSCVEILTWNVKPQAVNAHGQMFRIVRKVVPKCLYLTL